MTSIKNIFYIFTHDLKRLVTHFFALVIALGLCALPALYAWFNIYANWDPYSNTGSIRIAVANLDTGIKEDGEYLNFGEEIEEDLRKKDSIGWVFVESRDEAKDGVLAGEYYAALVIDEHFSDHLYHELLEGTVSSQIIYYVNEKKNAVATKITDTAVSTVQTSLNRQVVGIIAQKVFEETANIAQNLEEEDAASQIESQLVKVRDELVGYEELIDDVIAADELTKDALLDAANGTKQADSKINEAKGAIEGLDTTAFKIDVTSSLKAAIGALDALLGISEDVYDSLGITADMLDTMNLSMLDIKELLMRVEDRIDNILSSFKGSNEEEKIQMIAGMFTGDPESIGEFFADPVILNENYIYPIDYYGSGVTPFYTILAIWVGMTILVSILKVHAEYPECEAMRPYELYFGRYLLFFLLSQIQTAIIISGNLFILKVQCLHPGWMYFAAAVASFVFSLLVYSLTISFGDIGKALAVVVMVIQIAGSGGTFPIEILPGFFREAYKFVPFSYAIDALRECIGGMYGMKYVYCLLYLLIFAVAALVIGLLIRLPLIGLNHYFEKRMEDTHMM